MEKDAAHRSRWGIAEVVFGIPFLAGFGLHQIVPFSITENIFSQIFAYSGIALKLTGIVLIISARREFALSGQPTDPGHPTNKLVKPGMFAISRNPIYLISLLFEGKNYFLNKCKKMYF